MSLRDEPIELAEALLKTYEAPITAFVNVAERFCAVVANRNMYTQVGFLEAIEPPLAELYVRAIALPDSSLWFREDGDDEDATVQPDPKREELASYVDVDQQMAIAKEIERLLGDYNLFNLVFDPYGNDESVTASLGDDVVTIYAPLATYLPLFRSGKVPEMREALWNWRFEFGNLMGWRLTGALRAIHWLIHSLESTGMTMHGTKADWYHLTLTNDNNSSSNHLSPLPAPAPQRIDATARRGDAAGPARFRLPALRHARARHPRRDRVDAGPVPSLG